MIDASVSEDGSGTPITLVPDSVPNSKRSPVTVVFAVTPGTFRMNVDGPARNGLWTGFRIEAFAFAYALLLFGPPMIVGTPPGFPIDVISMPFGGVILYTFDEL